MIFRRGYSVCCLTKCDFEFVLDKRAIIKQEVLQRVGNTPGWGRRGLALLFNWGWGIYCPKYIPIDLEAL